MSEPTPPKNRGMFPDAQQICILLICISGFLSFTRPAHTTAQVIFRVSVTLAGVIGLIIIWVRKKRL